MACQIKRNSNGAITQVLAPNGKDSILYRDIVNNLSNPQVLTQVKQDPYVSMVLGTEYVKGTDVSEVGLAAWSKAYSPGFINQFGNWKTQTIANTDVNGEPSVDALFPDLKTSNVKEGVDFVFEQNPELASIGTQEQYSEYLDTVFPDSKVKDIVYHGTKSNEVRTVFNKETIQKTGVGLGKGFFFSRRKDYVERDVYGFKKIGSYLLNTANPINGNPDKFLRENDFNRVPNKNKSEIKDDYLDDNGERVYTTDRNINFESDEERTKVLQQLGYDAVDFNKEEYSNEIVVFEPEQIHILGSKQDIEGFKKFVSGGQLPSTVDNIINMKRWTQTKNNCPQL